MNTKKQTELPELWRYVEAVKPQIEHNLQANLPLAPKFVGAKFNEAVNYALFPGGKRLRPVLTLLGAELIGGKSEKIISSAAAVEFVHTSSLVFDDLPCMDDAFERRGKTSLHQKFGEGTAVLVGLALLNASYGLVFNNVNGNAKQAIRAHAELVECIGASGMVGGQTIDLALAQNGISDCGEFERLRNLKTSALIRMALRVGAIMSNASESQLETLTHFASLLGDAYQTSDDLLDLQEDLRVAQANGRRTNFALGQGIEAAQKRVENLINEAKDVLLTEFGDSKPANLLCAMADYIAQRKA